jgi:putative ABC transport system permease protein
MRWYYKLPLRLRSLFRKNKAELDLREELQFHLQNQIDEFVAQGMHPQEARRAASKFLGGVEQVKEECRDARQVNFIDNFLDDIRFSLRLLRKSPGFTAVAILTLSFGIGATSAIFGVVDAVLLRPLPYPDAGRLVMIWEVGKAPGKAPETLSVSWQDYQDWRTQVRSLEHLGIFRFQNVNLTRAGAPDRLLVSMTSADVFSALGVHPLLGRTFLPQDDQPGATPVAILSETTWRNRFAAAPDILGREVTLDGANYEVVGVMPISMRFPAQVDGWLPLGPFVASMPRERGNHPNLTALARLRSGVTFETAQGELDTIAARLSQQYPDSNTFMGARVRSLFEVIAGGIRTNLLVLLAAVIFVLLIACVNIANLMLARGETRLREVAVRRALGASRARLVNQMLTESVVLALCGAVLGSGMAWAALELLVKSKPTSIPRIEEVGVNATVVGFTCLVSLIVAALFGLWPALRITSLDPQLSLRDQTRTSSAGSRLRPFLVAAEAGLATMLLISSALLIRSFTHLARLDLGFQPEHVLTMRVALPGQSYPSPEKAAAFYRDVLGRVSALPVVNAVGISSLVPLSGGGAESSIMPEGGHFDVNNPGPGCTFGTVSGGYFRAMGIALDKGRSFDEHDAATNSPVIVVDEAAAQSLWPAQDPLGKRVAFEYRGTSIADPQPIWREVVGVVDRVRHYSLTGASARVQVYVPYTQPPLYFSRLPTMALIVRTNDAPAAVTASIRREVAAVDGNLPVFLVRTMTEYVDSTLEQPRLSMSVLASFGGLALLLAAVGIYGVLSYSVSQRTREIGIRMALGATRGSVLRYILRQGAIVSVVGIVAGMGASLASMRLIRDLLFGVSPTDLATYIAIPLLLLAVAFCATIIPARRATRVDPMVALRYE